METMIQVLQRRYSRNPAGSIEETVGSTTSSIEPLPAEIDDLIDNKAYRNKFRKIVRDGFLRELLELAELARTKAKPSRWFATVTAKANWQGTLEFLAKLRQVAKQVAEVAKRVRVPKGSMRVVFKACWRLQNLAIRHAVTAAEIGREPFKLFVWLCWKGSGTGVERIGIRS